MSVKNLNSFSKYILERLWFDLNDEYFVQEWYIRIITIQILINKNILHQGFTSDKDNNIILCQEENDLFKELFDDNINELMVNYPITFFSPKMINELTNYFNNDFKVEELGNLQEDYQDFIRLNHFTSTNRNSNTQVNKKNITAVTQIFTPLMVSKYMVENTVFNERISSSYKILDPCLGTGNILLVAMDKLIECYEKNTSYSKTTILDNIFGHLYGFDIDKQAIRLAKFIFSMKAYEYDNTYLSRLSKIKINFYWLKESNQELNLNNLPCEINDLLLTFKDASLKGSLTKIGNLDFSILEKEIVYYPKYEVYYQLAKLLSQKYDVVLTNPPYMGRKVLPDILTDYLNMYYPYGKSELYTSFMERCLEFLKPSGYLGMITLHTWMFIKSFANLRKYVLTNYQMVSLLHLGKSTFENLNAYNALACAFVIENRIPYQKVCFVKLTDFETLKEKEEALVKKDKTLFFYQSQDKFLKLESYPLVYWINSRAYELLVKGIKLGSVSNIRQGLATGDNKKFVRMWYEVPIDEICFNASSVDDFLKKGKKYAPYNKGGNQLKWYATSRVVIKFNQEAFEQLKKQGNHLPSRECYFQEGITWSLFGFNTFNVRYKENGYVFDVSGSSLFTSKENLKYYLAFLSSSVAYYFLSILAPTVNFQVGNIASLPVIVDRDKIEMINESVDKLINNAYLLDKEEEDSWNFRNSTILEFGKNVSFDERLSKYLEYINGLTSQIYENESLIDQMFKDIYQMDVDENKKIKYEMKTSKEIVQSLISYLVGVVFGRYHVKEYVSEINNQTWILVSDIVLEIHKLLEIYQIKEMELEKYLNQKIEDYLNHNFFKYHLKKFSQLPIYWYKRENKQIYIAYYHQIKEQVVIDYDKGIYQNYLENYQIVPLLHKIEK